MKKILILFAILAFATCENNEPGVLNCTTFQTAILEKNEGIVRSEIEKLTTDLSPAPTPEDNIGHMSNLQILTDRINSGCEEITASVLCYACIETYPPLSEILVEFVSDNTPVSATIDIVTSENDILRFGGLYTSE
jgi:hypothetical protein